MKDKVNILRKWLVEDTNVVVFTGAGVSTASGVLDFRGKNGLSKLKHDVSIEESLSYSYFVKHPESFYEFYRKNMVYDDVHPNFVHDWISSLQEDHQVTVITQNIDSLHKRAGSKNVLELHGNGCRFYCTRCGKEYLSSCLKQVIPHCVCGGIIRPDIVLYEEFLDDEVISKGIFAMMRADLLIVMGSSLVVNPAASLLQYYQGNHMVIINKGETPYDKRANLVIDEDIVKVVKELVKK